MRIGFIGAGNIAHAHAKALRSVDGANLEAVFDLDEAALTKFTSEEGGRPTRSMEELFDQVDAVYVLTPPRVHVQPTLAAIEHGLPVLCEKPISVSLSDAKTMVDAAERRGVLLAMDFNNRARPQLQRVRDAVETGEIGEVLSCWIRRLGYTRPDPETDWRTSRDSLAGMTIQSISHDIDMLRFVVGEIGLVSAVVGSSMPQVEGYDDNLTASLIFESGAIGNIQASWSSRLGHGSRGVIGSAGAVSVEGPDLWTMTHTRFASDADSIERIEKYSPKVSLDKGYVGVSREFVRAVAEGTRPLSTGQDGLRALEISHALLESASTRSFVDSRGFQTAPTVPEPVTQGV